MMNKKLPKVSFVLGIYNAERTLRQCLDGILMQDYPWNKYEIIIVDGGSSDDTIKIINEYAGKNRQLRLLHNPAKLSEGRGMSKDIGVKASTGEIIIFLDHDNIILHKDWLNLMVSPYQNRGIMATQSFLSYKETDSNFLKYVNATGVEDSFAIPYSIVSQAIFNPRNFELLNDSFYVHKLSPDFVLFGGANGGSFRKEVFRKINGYTRDVDVYASMAEYRMKVAVVKGTRLYHATSSSFLDFLMKKGIYFYRFIKNDYKVKKFQWIPRDFKGKIRFYLRVMHNLSIIGPLFFSIRQFLKTGRFFWLLHPGYIFFMTLEYGFITLFKIKNFLEYGKK